MQNLCIRYFLDIETRHAQREILMQHSPYCRPSTVTVATQPWRLDRMRKSRTVCNLPWSLLCCCSLGILWVFPDANGSLNVEC
ncbi:hypothetical protein B0H12DRAFT_811015 [Mycena haematopus]|nr:hypothetical protein B0H12DRAFT_811015 [Mycena haematopus]